MPIGIYPRKSIQSRFWEKVNIKSESECWVWTGGLSNGYGKFKFNGKTISAHRMAYILTHGEIEDGLLILHTCDIKPCCNPKHLIKGTHTDNMRDMNQKGRRNTKGIRNASHKLSEIEVLEIRAKIRSGYTQKCLAIEYGVMQPTISKIENRKKWKHI
jgi:DNA-binding XRE family transcriptional regulator